MPAIAGFTGTGAYGIDALVLVIERERGRIVRAVDEGVEPPTRGISGTAS